MIQPLPRVISNVGYGHATQELAINDGNSSGELPGRYAPMARAGAVLTLTVYRKIGLPDVSIEIFVDGVASGMALTLDSATEQATVSGNVPYTAGQRVTYKYTAVLQLFPGFSMGVCVEIDTDELCFGIAAISGTFGLGGGHYGGAFANGYWADNRSSQSINALDGSVTTLALRRFSSPTGGSFKAWIEIDTVLQDGSGGTVDTSCEIVDAGSPVQIVTFVLPVTPQQKITVKQVRLGSEGAFATDQVGAGIGFTPDNPNAFMMCGGSNDAIWDDPLFQNWKWNHSIQDTDPSTNIEEHQAPVGLQAFAVTGMYVEHNLAPGTDEHYTDTVLRNGISSDIIVDVTGPSVSSGLDLGREIYSATDLITIDLLRSAGAAAGGAFYWGLSAEIVNLAHPGPVIPPGIPGSFIPDIPLTGSAGVQDCLHGSVHPPITLTGSV